MEQSVVSLDGDWYHSPTLIDPGKLKSVEDLESFSRKYIRSFISSNPDFSDGIGEQSFVTIIQGVQEEWHQLSLQFRADTAARVYFFPVGERPLYSGGVGVVSNDRKWHQPQIKDELLKLPVSKSGDYFLIIQVQNVHNSNGVIWQGPIIGQYHSAYFYWHLNRIIEAIAIGVILILTLWYLFMYLHRRQEIANLWLAVFCFCVLLRCVAISGHMFPAFFFESNLFVYGLQRRLEYIPVAISGASSLGFLVYLLGASGFRRVSHTLMIATSVFGFIVLVLPLRLLHTLPVLITMNALLIISMVFGYIIVAVSVKKKRKGSYILATGVIPIMLAVVNDVLVSFGVGDSKIFLVHLGFSCLAFCLGQVVAIRYAETYRRSEKLGRDLTALNHELMEKQKSNDHLISELKKLVYPHQVNQIEKGDSLEDTMPIGSKNAYVICFDIQNSGDLGHSKNKTFFRALMRDCNQIMMENYDGSQLRANAYMLKEMGDGFLCSINFPFLSYENQSHAAFDLGERFILAFREAVNRYLEQKSVYCAVGIVKGEVSGYFPTAGLKHYDLSGDTIVKARRYESMRKLMFEKGVKSSDIMILQEDVFKALPSEYRKRCKAFHLENYRIRDDYSATVLYYVSMDEDVCAHHAV